MPRVHNLTTGMSGSIDIWDSFPSVVVQATIAPGRIREGDSLYLLGPDGHKLELHIGDWRSRLAAYRRRPHDGMEFF
jgi:hypothetical protein